MDLRTQYMGLALPTPLVASASPRNDTLVHIRALEDAGAGAVVLPSLFAEQVEAAEHRHQALSSVGALSSPEAASYFPAEHLEGNGDDRYFEVIRHARAAVDIPVIASLNAVSPASWIHYAALLQAAGASAIELNLYFVPTDLTVSGAEVEQRYVDIVKAVREHTSIPLAAKLSPYFSAPGHLAIRLADAGADAVVLFNRFYQPDIDVVRLRMSNELDLSQPAELRLPLLWIALLHGRIQASLAASSGVHGSDDVVKCLLAGADVVMTTSALLRHGTGRMHQMVQGLSDWLERRGMDSLLPIRGLLSQGRINNPADYARANYIQILQSYVPSGHAAER